VKYLFTDIHSLVCSIIVQNAWPLEKIDIHRRVELPVSKYLLVTSVCPMRRLSFAMAILSLHITTGTDKMSSKEHQ